MEGVFRHAIPEEQRAELIDGVLYDMASPTDIHQFLGLEICDRDKFKEGRIFGAPDLVVEVLSEVTRKKDASLKLQKYMNSGAREYWMVDPANKRVCVYCFEKDIFPKIYTFEHKVPVGIFEGECEVDFSEIYEYISFLYEQQHD